MNAAVQALLVVVAPREPLDATSALLAVASGLVLLLTTLALWWTAVRSPTARTLVLVVAAACVVVVLAIAAPYLVPVAVAVASPLIARGGFTSALELARRHPRRVTVLLVVTIVAVLLAAVLAAVLGLLVTGAPASAIAWLCIGTGAALLVRAWTRLSVRPAQPAQP